MQIKPKKCKGTGKASSYSGCGNIVLNRRFGLCDTCYKDFLLSTDAGQEIMLKARLCGKKRVQKVNAIKNRQEKESLKSIQRLIQEARKPFQDWIRLVDINLGCISCGSTTADIYDAGHFYKAELYSGLIFDEHNVHKQCRKCNQFLNGNEGNYRLGLVKRYGQEYVDRIDEKADGLRVYKFTREELKSIKLKYQKLLNEAKKTNDGNSSQRESRG